MTTAGLEYWDYTAQMGSVVDLITADAGNGTITGPAVTTETNDVLYGTSTKVQRWNTNAGPTWARTFSPVLDLTSRSIALMCSIKAPEQNVYWTGLLAADYHVGIDASLTLAAGHTYPAGPTAAADATTINAGAALIQAANYDAGTATFTGLTVVSGASMTLPAGTRICTGSGVATPTLAVTIQLAASSGTTGNRYDCKWLGGGYGGWNTLIAVIGDCDATLGPEVVSVGTPPALDNIGYAKVLTTVAAPAGLPRTDFDGFNDYRGPQPGPHQFEIKWDALVSFVRTRRTVVAFSFDDARITPWTITSPEAERPRPGAPNGVGRVSHMLIPSNAMESDAGASGFVTSRQVQQLASNGHEAALHAFLREQHHEAEDTGGFGPFPRHEARQAGNALASQVDSIAWLTDRGIHAAEAGGITHAMPLSSPCSEPHEGWPPHGIRASRSLSDGGAQPIVTGAATNAAECTGFTEPNTYRFLSWPTGDVGKLVSSSTLSNLGLVKTGGSFTIGSPTITGTAGLTSAHEGCQILGSKIPDGSTILDVTGSTVTMSKNALSSGPVGATAITVGDKRGHRAAMRQILEACMQGLSLSIHSHAQEENGTSFTESRWSREMWREVFDYCLDVQLGTNTYGNNPALAHYPDLRVVTLLELVTGSAPQRPAIDDWGMAA